jgi:cerevisin
LLIRRWINRLKLLVVLGSNGAGATSGVIAGVNYALEQFKRDSTIPSIATMSLGGSAVADPSDPLGKAIKAAIAAGMHFTIAAGNSNAAASTSSPANVVEANTIGAVDSNSTKASFSNYGPLIDVWALGVNVKSAWINGSDSTIALSGTSMAT